MFLFFLLLFLLFFCLWGFLCVRARYVFPGLALGAHLLKTGQITDGMLTAAAEAVSYCLTDEEVVDEQPKKKTMNEKRQANTSEKRFSPQFN